MHWQPQYESPLSNLSFWLTLPGSLTAALRSHCGKVKVKVLQEKKTVFDASEAHTEFPCVPGDAIWLREVMLCDADGGALVFARSMMPLDLVPEDLLCLRSKSLGERILFKSGTQSIERTAFEVACIEKTSPLYHRGFEWTDRQKLYARRSCFKIDSGPLLVTELFYPCLIDE